MEPGVQRNDADPRCSWSLWRCHSGCDAVGCLPTQLVGLLAGAQPVGEGFVYKNVLASYVHLHFGSASQSLATSLVERCRAVDTVAAGGAAAAAAIGAARAAGGSGHHAKSLPIRNGMVHVASVPNLRPQRRIHAQLRRRCAFPLCRDGQMWAACCKRNHADISLAAVQPRTQRPIVRQLLRPEPRAFAVAR